ncbi:MAG: nucleotidyl transferase AbiEii/AbiGii toxin family protein [Salibacteraceae bacterium]
MLHTETVESGTFSILKEIMQLPSLRDHRLVGGTALALRYGHRISEDLDLFCANSFSREEVIQELSSKFSNRFSYNGANLEIGIFGFIDQVKIDIVHYPHKFLQNPKITSNIRLAHDMDIGAMKIQAVLGRAMKKDFWDLAELLRKYSLSEMLSWHQQKYPNQMLAISIPEALIYFEEAEHGINPISINGKSWSDIKAEIKQAVNDYLKVS